MKASSLISSISPYLCISVPVSVSTVQSAAMLNSEDHTVIPIPSKIQPRFVEKPSPPRSETGPSMTGTAQFMAKVIYRSTRGLHHDLESFLLVIIYSIYRSLQNDPDNTELRDEYEAIFNNFQYSQICAARGRLSPLAPDRELVKALAIVNDRVLFFLQDQCRLFIYLQNNKLADSFLLSSADPFCQVHSSKFLGLMSLPRWIK